MTKLTLYKSKTLKEKAALQLQPNLEVCRRPGYLWPSRAEEAEPAYLVSFFPILRARRWPLALPVCLPGPTLQNEKRKRHRLLLPLQNGAIDRGAAIATRGILRISTLSA